ncbi:Hypothetical predicted protein [Pelobates cultripes]|nr:Hypothetical predicted protein [Pelobates cultripes]
MRQPDRWDPYDTLLQRLPDQSGYDARAHTRRDTQRDSRSTGTACNLPTLNTTERLIHRLIQAPGSQHMTPLPTQDQDHSASETELHLLQTATLNPWTATIPTQATA